MATNDRAGNERVVKIVETRDGTIARTFYGIYDPNFDHWMSDEPFDGLIWTKDLRCRQGFSSRKEAQAVLERFLDWREEQQTEADVLADISSVQEAA